MKAKFTSLTNYVICGGRFELVPVFFFETHFSAGVKYTSSVILVSLKTFLINNFLDKR